VSLCIPSSSRSPDHDPHLTIYYIGYLRGRFAGLKHRQLARQVRVITPPGEFEGPTIKINLLGVSASKFKAIEEASRQQRTSRREWAPICGGFQFGDLCLLHHKSKLCRDSIFQIQVIDVVAVLHQTVPRAKQFGCKLPYTQKQGTMKFPQDFKIFSWCIRQDWLHLNYVKRHRSTSTTLCAITTSFCGCTGSTSTTPCAGSTLHAATTRHPAAQGLPQPCRTPRLLV
jgi:hypothetical protein